MEELQDGRVKASVFSVGTSKIQVLFHAKDGCDKIKYSTGGSRLTSPGYLTPRQFQIGAFGCGEMVAP